MTTTGALPGRTTPNDLLRRARLAVASRAKPGRPLGREELAQLVDAAVWEATGRVVSTNGGYIGVLERGVRRWPKPWTRAALRTILGVDTDADLGFWRVPPPDRWHYCATRAQPAGTSPTVPTALSDRNGRVEWVTVGEAVALRAGGLSVAVRVAGVSVGRRGLRVVGGGAA
jgi:hypothetical protein